MVTTAEVKWGKYKEYEGPYWYGHDCKFELPPNPDNNHKILATISATEGSSYSAINAYDRCIYSAGLIQWCSASYFLVEKMFGYIASKDPALLNALGPALAASGGATFNKNGNGRWRFFFNNGHEVDEKIEQKRLYLLNSTGHRGDWDDASKEHAKIWVAAGANFLAQEPAKPLQTAYTAARVKWFATKQARSIILDDQPDEGWVGGTRAAFWSFGANLPAVASKHLIKAAETAPGPKWSQDWCIHVLKELTFGPGIAIYPGRYGKIRPVIEKLYGIDLPDYASELKAWETDQDADHDAPTDKEPTFTSVEEIQRFLDDQGYDLGPAGVDGHMGMKTMDAIRTFQKMHGLDDDGLVGKLTRAAMLKVHREKVCG